MDRVPFRVFPKDSPISVRLFENKLVEVVNFGTVGSIGRALGIYMGHDQQHEGHIPRVLLAIMESEGVVEQDDGTKAWRLRASGTSKTD